jgi:hypothetical protein
MSLSALGPAARQLLSLLQLSVGSVGLTKSFALSGVQAAGSVGNVIAIYWILVDDSETSNWQNVNNSETSSWALVDNAETANWALVNNAETSGWALVDDTETSNWTLVEAST